MVSSKQKVIGIIAGGAVLFFLLKEKAKAQELAPSIETISVPSEPSISLEPSSSLAPSPLRIVPSNGGVDSGLEFLTNPALRRIVSESLKTGESLLFPAAGWAVAETAVGAGSMLPVYGISAAMATQMEFTNPYSGYLSMIPIIGPVLGGFLEGLIGEGVPEETPELDHTILRDFENQRIMQELAYASLNEPYKTMVNNAPPEYRDINASDEPFPYIWPMALDFRLNNKFLWTEVSGLYFFNFENYKNWGLATRGTFGYPPGITIQMWKDALALWYLFKINEEIKKEPVFGMVDPRCQYLYNFTMTRGWNPTITYTEGGYALGAMQYDWDELEAALYRDSQGRVIKWDSTEFIGTLMTYEDALKKYYPEKYEERIAEKEAAAQRWAQQQATLRPWESPSYI